MLDVRTIEAVRVDKLSISTSLLVQAAQQLGLSYRILSDKVVWMSNGNESHFFRSTRLPCNDMVAGDISNNKYFVRRLLREDGMPVPKTVVVRNPAAWRSVLTSSLRFPLVVKPINASHALGASMHIMSASELRKAVERAFSFMKKAKTGDRVLVEEYFVGDDIRLLVVGQQVVSALRREPAYVVGDGRRTIKELIADFNGQWRSAIAKYDYPLCPIPIDAEVFRFLRTRQLQLSSVPTANQKVYLRWNANVSTGGRTEDVTDQLNPAINAVAVRCAALLHLPVAGIDILCKDMRSADTSAKNLVVLEVNSAPGLDIHHYPSEGKGRDVSRLILRYIFGQTARPTPSPV